MFSDDKASFKKWKAKTCQGQNIDLLKKAMTEQNKQKTDSELIVKKHPRFSYAITTSVQVSSRIFGA